MSRSETPTKFSARANRLYAEAQRLSRREAESLEPLDRCMAEAKGLRMTWVEGLEYSISKLKTSGRSA